MKRSFESLFKSLPETELPAGLESRIFDRIAELRLREARLAIIFSYARLVISGGLSIAAFSFVGSTIVESDFMQIASLFLSDMTLFAQHGSSLLWFLLETFPAIPIVLLLTPIFLLLVSVSLHMSSLHKYRFSIISFVTI